MKKESKKEGTRTASSLFRFACIEMAVYFLYAAYVNSNDPDYFLWITFYLFASGLCLYSSRSKPREQDNSLLLAGVLLPAVTLSYDNIVGLCRGVYEFTMMDLDFDSEVGRENMGLLIVVSWFSLLMINARSQLWYDLVMLILATSVCSATFIVPYYLLHKEKLVEHCQGMGPFQ